MCARTHTGQDHADGGHGRKAGGRSAARRPPRRERDAARGHVTGGPIPDEHVRGRRSPEDCPASPCCRCRKGVRQPAADCQETSGGQRGIRRCKDFWQWHAVRPRRRSTRSYIGAETITPRRLSVQGTAPCARAGAGTPRVGLPGRRISTCTPPSTASPVMRSTGASGAGSVGARSTCSKPPSTAEPSASTRQVGRHDDLHAAQHRAHVDLDDAGGQARVPEVQLRPAQHGAPAQTARHGPAPPRRVPPSTVSTRPSARAARQASLRRAIAWSRAAVVGRTAIAVDGGSG